MRTAMAARLILTVILVCGIAFASTPVNSCSVISSPGTYELTSDLNGAPNLPYTLGANAACIILASGNVTFSCGTYSITNDGTLNAGGIVVNGSTWHMFETGYENITIENCSDVNSYSYGIYLYYVS
ncbi:MAG: hypothetical protein GY852_10655, partial [bacterium]|nr:hypothetical protein [bacterium]